MFQNAFRSASSAATRTPAASTSTEPIGPKVVTQSALEADFARTVLVVEDEVLIRLMIAEHLRGCGYRVIEAGSGDEAIEVLRRTALTIDVVFSDIQMPGSTDGFALAQWVRRERPASKVVLTSGIAKASEAADALCEEGRWVPKPYSPAELEERIRLLLAQ